MSVIEFHPDDLLDRELNGTLSDADRLRLAAHLERCAVCRLECQLRLDFEQELGPSQPASDLHPVVSHVLQAAGAEPLIAPTQVGSARPPMRRWVAAAVVACALFGTVAAAAQLGLKETMLEWLRGDGAPERSTQHAPRAAVRAQPAAAAVAQTRVESAEIPHQVAAAPATMEPSRRVLEQRRLLAPGRSPALERATAKRAMLVEAGGSRAQEVDARENVEAAAPQIAVQSVLLPGASARGNASASATATTLFELASHARRSGASEDASALYRELQARFPRSPEARLSVALLARLQLDRGQFAAALAGFDSYLDTAHRALREEAMVGRARTLERLGRARDAEHAWRDLLEAYPQSAAAGTARRRLGHSTP